MCSSDLGTLSANCKYTASSIEADKNDTDHAKHKPGYFASEKKLIEDIRTKTGTGAARNPITFLVEAADDIVYSVADIEDGIKKGILTWTKLEAYLRQEKDPTAIQLVKELLASKENILKAGRDTVPENLPDDTHGTAFRTAAIGIFVPHVVDAFK